jgi:secreted Zn-dependent insulinase-like peptidase
MPDSLATFVLGHEGKNSLLSELKARKLATDLNSGDEAYLNSF